MDTIALSRILVELRDILLATKCVSIHSRWETYTDAIDEISDMLAELEVGETDDLLRYKLMFAPTSSLQDTSIDCGWGEDFLALSNLWDQAIG